MKKLISIILILITINGFTQISHGGTPIGLAKNLSPLPIYTTPNLNIQPYIDEDIITDQHKDIAWRFGIEQFVNLNLSNSGAWKTLDNGDRLWRLKIESPNAKTINLNYSKFNIPIGSTFFVYNNTLTLGSFTSENNKKSGMFSTSLIKGDYVILEYYEPSVVNGQGIIEVASVVHGYRDLFNETKKAFGQSGACNVNAICDSSFWDNEIRSSVMLLTSGNTRFCSGALINNVLEDGTPYILTADHCTPTANNNIFMFNYQSPTCATNNDGPTTQTISSCTIRARDTPSDFLLLELSSIPPSNYNVFYAGWSAIDVPPTKGTGIHFPRLDVKKISHEIDPLVESEYTPLPGINHWRVIDWDSGTTEGGSSGSPLFDQNHRIVGQLHGGTANCGNDGSDYYGKFSYSWETDPLNTKQLKFWLDPNNSGVTTINGFDPNGTTLTTDAVLLNIGGIDNFICGDSVSPQITIRNNGSNNLTTLTINYELDGGGFNSINWTGNIATYAIDTINIPTSFIIGGFHNIIVNCTNPNSTTDQNLFNDSASLSFNSSDKPPVGAKLHLKPDDYGTEISWKIWDNNSGLFLFSGGGYPDLSATQTFTDNLCLYHGCFKLTIYDNAGDGYCCSFGTGSAIVTEDAIGDTLINNTTFNTDSISFNFCLDSLTSVQEYNSSSFNIYPNPNNGIFTIISQFKNPYHITIYDMIGKLTYQLNDIKEGAIKIDLSTLKKGIYLVTINSKNRKIIKRLIIQ